MYYKGFSNELPEQLIEPVIDISKRASEAILEIYYSDFTMEKKNDGSPLTMADTVSHNVITEALKKLTPDIPILSEESINIPFKERKRWEVYWLVDPLDGTKEFINRNDEFTVNIALVYKHKPIMSVVHAPATNIIYYASKGNGAYKITEEHELFKISTRTTRVEKIIVAESRSHPNEKQKRFFKSLGHNAKTISCGSSLKFCLIAEGHVDVYARFGPTSEWDTAAAHCVVKEAGGDITDMNFIPLNYNTKDSVLNPHFLVMGDKNFDWAPYIQKLTS